MAARGDPSRIVAVFARAPVAGQTKTRLIPRLGAEGAANLHRQLIERTLQTAVHACVGQVELWCAPDCQHPWFAECALRFDITLRTQSKGDIGTRMLAATRHVLARAGQMLLVGTDCPALTVGDLRQCATDLDAQTDVVLLPVEDGGYTLIALRHAHAALFHDIDWSTDRVMPQTRASMRALGLRWSELPLRWDLDRPEDVDRLEQLWRRESSGQSN